MSGVRRALDAYRTNWPRVFTLAFGYWMVLSGLLFWFVVVPMFVVSRVGVA